MTILHPDLEIFSGYEITVNIGDVLSASTDAIATAGNSEIFMAGGLDLALVQKYGPDLPFRIQKISGGHIDVGKGLAVRLPGQPWLLCYVPTMRTPGNDRRPPSSMVAYRAARAAIALASIMGAKSLTLPLFCTGYGRWPEAESRRQIDLAIKEMVAT